MTTRERQRTALALQLTISLLPALSAILKTSSQPYFLLSASLLLSGLAITHAWLSAEIETSSSETGQEIEANNTMDAAVTLYTIICVYAAINLVWFGRSGFSKAEIALVSVAMIFLAALRYIELQCLKGRK